jgi:hypothetical protein
MTLTSTPNHRLHARDRQPEVLRFEAAAGAAGDLQPVLVQHAWHGLLQRWQLGQPLEQLQRRHRRGRRRELPQPTSEKDAKLAQKLGQLQPFIAVFPHECMGQLASFGPT